MYVVYLSLGESPALYMKILQVYLIGIACRLLVFFMATVCKSMYIVNTYNVHLIRMLQNNGCNSIVYCKRCVNIICMYVYCYEKQIQTYILHKV